MPLLSRLVLRLVIVAAGLLAAAAIALVLAVLLALWLVRAGWALVTGRPVQPLVMRMGARAAFEQMMRRAAARGSTRTPRADAAAGRRAPLADVTDVEPK